MSESKGPLGFDDDEDVAPGADIAPPPAGDDEPQHDGRQSYQPRGTPVDTAKYTWFVGIAATVLIAVLFISSLFNNDAPNATGVKVGHVVPPFAAPMAIGGAVGDVNVADKPDDGSRGKVPACSIHEPTVFTVCDAYAKRPLVLAFMATLGKQCTSELDVLADVSEDFPGVAVAAVAIKGNLGDLRDLVRKRGWPFPVAYDRDGVLAQLYGVPVCPQITYVRRGGRAARTTFGLQDEAKLRARFAALASGGYVPK